MEFKPLLGIFFSFLILSGGIYPWVVSRYAQVFKPYSSSGSPLYFDSYNIGSAQLGVNDPDPRFIHHRDVSPAKAELVSRGLSPKINTRAQDLTNYPSASDLDPMLSQQAVQAQLPRLAQVWRRPQVELEQLLQSYQTEQGREVQVNVLKFNLYLQTHLGPKAKKRINK